VLNWAFRLILRLDTLAAVYLALDQGGFELSQRRVDGGGGYRLT
jgi:hypothetical protein